MNAFDAVMAGAGDTGLASLLATTTAPQAGAPGGTPFAQLLDQLNTLPVPQAGATNVALPVPQTGVTNVALPVPQAGVTNVALPVSQAGVTNVALPVSQAGVTNVALPAPQSGTSQPAAPSLALSTLPVQRSPQAVSPFLREVPQGGHVPVRPAKLECGLHLPAIGKIMPPVAPGGTILPVPSIGEAVPSETTDTVATLPVADHLSDPAGQIPAGALPLVAAQLVAMAPLPAAAGSATPVRSASPVLPAGTLRAELPVPSEVAAPTMAAPAAPTAPAVTVMAADAPAAATSEGPTLSERGVKGPVFAEALPRPMAQLAADLGGAGVVEMPAAAPQPQAAPQQPAMQDLTRIVERLAAAREAAAPAATQLALDHAEFGPLSLSIQQGDRGELAIAVAAADRDSQVALVAAINQAEGPGFEQAPERRGSESAGREQATTSQQGESRGQGGQRDRLAGQQQQRQTVPQRGPAPERDGETRSGTYA